MGNSQSTSTPVNGTWWPWAQRSDDEPASAVPPHTQANNLAAVATTTKPHSLSETTTISSSVDGSPHRLADDISIEIGSSLDDQQRDGSAQHHRKSLWDEVVSFFFSPRLVPCYDDSGAETPPSSPRHRKRPRSAPAPIHNESWVETKHHAFWLLVQQLLELNDVVMMIRALQDYLVLHVGASQCAVYLVDPNTASMSRVIRGQPTISGIGMHRGLVGYVGSSKRPICRQFFDQELHYDASIDLSRQSVFQKLMCVPLIDGGNVYAVVQVTTRERTSEEEDLLDIKLLTWLGPILSSCMRKCIEFHDVLLSERTQKALLHIISSSDTEDTVLNLVDGVITGAGHITKAERLSLFMIDWQSQELWTLSSSYHEQTIRVPLVNSTLGYAARHQVTLNIADTSSDPRFTTELDSRRGIHTRCALYVPVGNCERQDSRPLAVLEILNKEGGDSFTLDDECAFEAFASEVAVILRRRSNEIEYIKLLADTRADKVLAQRAKSQVNLLECYTEYVANASTNHAADRLRHSFFKSHSRQCMVCTESDQDGEPIKHCELQFISSYDRPTNGQKADTATWRKLNRGPRRRIPLWDFNIFATDPEELPQLIQDIFLDFHVHEILKIDATTLRNFVMVVKESYHPNPFHNFMHAVSVLHSTYVVLKTTDASKMLQPLDIAACLIAAICHDVDHPGHTNSFEIVTRSQLALLYSDESVLERHHAYTTFRILTKDKSANILQNLSTTDFRYVRKMIIAAILGTDMAQHFKMCESLEKMLHPAHHQKSANAISSSKRDALMVSDGQMSLPESTADQMEARNKSEGASEILNVVRDAVFPCDSAASTPRNASNKSISSRLLSCTTIEPKSSGRKSQSVFLNGSLDDRTFLVKAIVHASDLCGQVFPKRVALKWSNLISKEFAYQALLEQAENLPVSYEHMDDPLQMVEGQHFFAQKIVLPLWALMYQLFPELECCVNNINDNVRHYENEMDRLKLTRQASDSAQSDEASALSDDEGMAVPGVARCTPAKFNSFRESGARKSEQSDGRSERSVFGASALDAIEASQSSASSRSRSDSSSSNEDPDENDGVGAEDEEVVEIADVESANLLPGRF
ncbi:hypothetical protein PINS_up003792 [Pythium insidiosum]|nr:hypothetical protein PINS_up003792 [Pythium insidiosum]